MSTEVLVYRHPDEFPEDVAQLFALGERDSVAFGAGWYRNFLQAVIRPGDLVHFYVLRRDGRAVAALPVMVKASWLPLHRAVESLGNYYTFLYAPLVDPQLDAAGLAPLLRAVRRAHSPMASLRLQPMDPQSRSYQVLLGALRLASLVPFEFYCFGNWFLRPSRDWPAFLAARDSKVRSTIKRKDKKLAQDGGRIEIIVDRTDLPRAIEAYERVYRASWKQQEPYPQFMPGLIAEAAASGWLRLGIVWLKAEPIAAQVWIVANGKADIYKLAYDEAFKEYSAGTVLTARLMQHVMEIDGVSEIDYLVGDDAYKKDWMSDRRERWGIVAYNPGTIAGALGALREALGRLVKRARLRLQALRVRSSPA